MKKIWFNNHELMELLADNGISLIVNENMEITIQDDEVEKINTLVRELAPAAQWDYGIEDLD